MIEDVTRVCNLVERSFPLDFVCKGCLHSEREHVRVCKVTLTPHVVTEVSPILDAELLFADRVDYSPLSIMEILVAVNVLALVFEKFSIRQCHLVFSSDIPYGDFCDAFDIDTILSENVTFNSRVLHELTHVDVAEPSANSLGRRSEARPVHVGFLLRLVAEVTDTLYHAVAKVEHVFVLTPCLVRKGKHCFINTDVTY